jgi:hypothetical protein
MKIFAQKCRSVIPQFPEEFRSRRRLKFVPIMAIAEMAGFCSPGTDKRAGIISR